MENVLHWIIFLTGGLLLVSTATARPYLFIATESSPPSSMMRERQVVGFASDKIRGIMERVGIDYQSNPRTLLVSRIDLWATSVRVAMNSEGVSLAIERKYNFAGNGARH